MNLREANGYTYGARSSIGADPYASRFVASTSVRNEVTDSAIVEMVKELRRIRTEPVSAQDLNNTKNKYAGNFVLQLENPATIANFALNIERYNLPKDFYKNYLKNINAVTMEDVQAAANKYVMVDNMRIVVAGKGKDVVEGLENLNLNGKKTPVFYFDKEGNKVDKPVYDKEIPEGVTAQTVYNSYLEAIGGKAKVEAVNTLSMTAGATMQGTPLELEIKKSKAGKMAQSLYVMGNVMSKQAFNGTSGYAMAQGQKVPYDEEQIAKGKTDALPFPELNLGEAKLVRIEAVDGSDAYVVMPSENVEDYYDVKSGLKVKSTQTRSQGAQTMVVTTLYKDYQEKEGIMFPMTISQSFGPQSIDFKVSNIVVNPEFADSDFE
jgi:zinc protease